MHPDVELVQPVLPRLLGRGAGVRGMGNFLLAIPDLEIAIVNASVQEPLVFIEFRFSGTLGKRHVEWGLVDRIELSDGLVRKRVSYFDPIPFLRAAVLQPSLWYRLVSALRSN